MHVYLGTAFLGPHKGALEINIGTLCIKKLKFM